MYLVYLLSICFYFMYPVFRSWVNKLCNCLYNVYFISV